MASKPQVVKDGIESCEPINVQFKFAGIDWTHLKSTGKAFHLGGREYSMSRFGTWALQEISGEGELETVFRDGGGIVAAITWALLQEYRDITAWVSNVRDCQFSLDVKKSRKKQILDEIRSGKVARTLEQRLQTLNSAQLYEKLKVKQIKIIGDGDTDDKRKGNDKEYGFSDEARMNRLLEAGQVANLMKNKYYSRAFVMLKRSLEVENDEVSRLQMLIRLSICAMVLDNVSEMEGAFEQIITLMNTVDVPAEEIEFYHKEYDTLFHMLSAKSSAIRGIEISFAFLEIARKIPDLSDRLDKITIVLGRICFAMNLFMALMAAEPGACLQCEMWRYIEKINDVIAFMQNQKDCDSLVRAQCIYFAEYKLSETKILLDKQKTEVFRPNTMEFKRMNGCWVDLPFISTRLQLHPEALEYFGDEEFRASIQQISRNPALLQQKIKDPKIAHANEILTSEFGIVATDEDIGESFEADNPSSAPSVSTGKSKKAKAPEKSVDKKLEAQKEKEMGNEAYKKKQFQKASSHYDKAISLDPANALLHSNKAAVYISQERFDLARMSCLTAINLTQNSDRHDVAKITARFARIEFLDKHPDLAMTLYQKSLRLNFDPKVQEQMKECEERILALRFMSSMRFPL